MRPQRAPAPPICHPLPSLSDVDTSKPGYVIRPPPHLRRSASEGSGSEDDWSDEDSDVSKSSSSARSVRAAEMARAARAQRKRQPFVMSAEEQYEIINEQSKPKKRRYRARKDMTDFNDREMRRFLKVHTTAVLVSFGGFALRVTDIAAE